MSGYFTTPVSGGGGVAVAPNVTYEWLGFDNVSAGAGTLLTTGGTNSYGAPVLLGTNTAEFNSVAIRLSTSSPTARFMISLGIGSTLATPLLTNVIFVINAGTTTIDVPINVPAGSAIYGKLQASSVGFTSNMALRGRVKGALDFAGFSQGVGLGVDTANSRPSSILVPMTNVWTAIHTAAFDYGAFMMYTANHTSAFTNSQLFSMDIGTGVDAASAVSIERDMYKSVAAGTLATTFRLSQQAIANGAVISARIQAAATGDSIFPGLIGFR